MKEDATKWNKNWMLYYSEKPSKEVLSWARKRGDKLDLARTDVVARSLAEKVKYDLCIVDGAAEMARRVTEDLVSGYTFSQACKVLVISEPQPERWMAEAAVECPGRVAIIGGPTLLPALEKEGRELDYPEMSTGPDEE